MRYLILRLMVFMTALLLVSSSNHAQSNRIDEFSYDATNNRVFVHWAPDVSTLYRVEQTSTLLTEWTNLTDWSVPPLSPSLSLASTPPAGSSSSFYRIRSTAAPVTYLIGANGRTTEAVCIRTDISNGMLRALAAFADTDSNGVADVARRDEIWRTASNSCIWLRSLTTVNPTGRLVRSSCLSDCSASNWSASFASSATDAFPLLGTELSEESLQSIAANNMPFIETVGGTSVYVRFPKSAVSNASLIQFSGNISIVDEDPLCVWHFDDMLYGIYGHNEFKCWADSSGVHMSWANPLAYKYQGREDDDEPYYVPGYVHSHTFMYCKDVWWDFGNHPISLPTDALSCDIPLDPGRYEVGLRTILGTTSGKEIWLLDLGMKVEVPRGNLLAYYPLDGNAQDASGNGNHGTANGTVTWSSGKHGSCASFSGNGAIRITENISLLRSAPFTIMAWVKVVKSGNSYQHIVSTDQRVSSSYRGVILQYSQTENALMFSVGTGGASYNSIKYNNPTANTWYHLAGTYDGSAMTLHINGVAQTPKTASFSAGSSPVIIGSNPRSLPSYIDRLNGDTDDVRIYNRILSATEIQTIMNE